MNDVQLVKSFAFEEVAVRVEVFDGEPWWVARDVMLALGYSENSDVNSVVSKVPEVWRCPKPFGTNAGVREMLCLSEQGLYFFLARSDKPKALPFQMWIAGDVIPQIRRTGAYAVQKTSAQMFLESAQLFAEQERRLAAVEAASRMQEQRLATVERQQEAQAEGARQLMTGVLDPQVEAGTVTKRTLINRIVRGRALGDSLPHADLYRRLYQEFRDRTTIDLVARARHRNSTPLDVAAAEGQIEQLYAVAYDIYVDRPLPILDASADQPSNGRKG